MSSRFGCRRRVLLGGSWGVTLSVGGIWPWRRRVFPVHFVKAVPAPMAGRPVLLDLVKARDSVLATFGNNVFVSPRGGVSSTPFPLGPCTFCCWACAVCAVCVVCVRLLCGVRWWVAGVSGSVRHDFGSVGHGSPKLSKQKHASPNNKNTRNKQTYC